MTKIKQLPL